MATVTVTSKLVRNYGAYSSEWGIEQAVEVNSRKDLIEAYAKMQEHLIASILDFEKNTLTRLPGFDQKRPPTIDQDKKPAREIEWVKAVGIFAERKKGKTYFYAKTAPGSKWNKHGAPLYWDDFKGLTLAMWTDKQIGDNLDIAPEDEMYFCILKVPGKPDKAIMITHKDEIDQ